MGRESSESGSRSHDWESSSLAAVGVSASVGLVFGYFGARASRLDPIKTLRYE